MTFEQVHQLEQAQLNLADQTAALLQSATVSQGTGVQVSATRPPVEQFMLKRSELPCLQVA